MSVFVYVSYVRVYTKVFNLSLHIWVPIFASFVTYIHGEAYINVCVCENAATSYIKWKCGILDFYTIIIAQHFALNLISWF